LSAELKGSFAGKDIDLGTIMAGNLLPTIGLGKISLSKEEKNLFHIEPQ
jgi:hypothetical protein